ncbi:MAG TPA: alpha-galactosidase [Acidimicrobiales bacterium]|nr:alpha-galactosidase [Acidimicrobiales bacterium]
MDSSPSATGPARERNWATLRRGGVAVVLDIRGPYMPVVVYWGKDLGDLTEAETEALPMARKVTEGLRARDRAPIASISPTRADGWAGWPGLSGHRRGLNSQPLFSLEAVETWDDDAASTFVYRGRDEAAGIVLEGELQLTREGLLKHRQTLTNVAGPEADPYEVQELPTLLPVPTYVVEVQDFAGRWGNEAQPQRRDLTQGTWLREQRRGRTGPDTPLVLSAGTKGFGFREGEVWGIHLGWSGDQRYLAQRLNTGTTLIGVAEILAPGEVILGPGESVTTPWAYGAYSGEGLDGMSARFHSFLRRLPAHPDSPRPVLLNIWEAVTFHHSFERIAELANIAAEIGIERFVIDDGWFGTRRDDKSGLGDWFVAPDVWPEGLKPIVDHVRSLGMEFGLWFEPEMVNLDSDLARAHPDWVLGTAGRMPPAQRDQQVLDVSIPGSFDYILERMTSLVAEYGIDFIKWDHNRDLADPVHRSGPRAGRPAVRDQTLATYRLMDALHERFPALEIESCSSGGSRVDLGVLERTQRVWASDCIDPIERARIVPGLATLLPLELIGSHVASPRSHTTGRQHDLPLRLIVAMFGHQGIEWDISSTTGEERKALADWVRLVKSFRALVHTGRLVRAERPRDPGTTLFGVVAQDRSEALFVLVRSQTSPYWGTPSLRLDGLDPALRYRVQRVPVPGESAGGHDVPALPPSVPVVATGAVIMGTGVHVPFLQPDQASLWHVSADS